MTTKKPGTQDTARPLTKRRKEFVAAFAASGSPTRAAREVGYAHPRVQGSRLLTNVSVQEGLAKLPTAHEARLENLIAGAEERRSFWTETMRNPEVAFRERLRASELLGRSYGDFVERVQTESNLEFQITRRIIHGTVAGADLELEDDE